MLLRSGSTGCRRRRRTARCRSAQFRGATALAIKVRREEEEEGAILSRCRRARPGRHWPARGGGGQDGGRPRPPLPLCLILRGGGSGLVPRPAPGWAPLQHVSSRPRTAVCGMRKETQAHSGHTHGHAVTARPSLPSHFIRGGHGCTKSRLGQGWEIHMGKERRS